MMDHICKVRATRLIWRRAHALVECGLYRDGALLGLMPDVYMCAQAICFTAHS